MKKSYRLIMGSALLLMMILSHSAWGMETDSGDSIRLFEVNAELMSDLEAAGPPELPFAGKYTRIPLSEILNLPVEKDEDIFPLHDMSEGKKGAPRRYGVDLYYFRLSFSRSVLERRGIDALRLEKEESDTLSKIRSLPSMLGDSSARETFGTIGDIFKPQLNLEIDF